jgi:glycosyltransferase involved in cell wall biosynthesis
VLAEEILSPAAPPVRQLTVLHVVEAVETGTLRHVLDLVSYASDVQHALAVPSRHLGESTASAVAAAQAAGARVERVEMGRFRVPHRHVLAVLALRRTINRLQPDVVHGHSSIGGAMARLATVGTGTPTVYTPHALTRSRWALVLERLLRGRAARLIAVSESERAFAVAQRVARPDQAVTIPNGVHPEPPPPPARSLRASTGVGEDVPLIGCVARLTWQKAPEVFVSACATVADQLPDAHFVLIGAGALLGQVTAAVRDEELEDRFHILPSFPNAAGALSELDVYALPSRFEGGPYTLLEAMRAGTPVVVTDVAGNRDLVEHGENGLLVPPDRPDALADGIVRLLGDAALRTRLIAGATRTIARCDVRTMAQAIAGVYRELCGTTESSAPAQPSHRHAPSHANA